MYMWVSAALREHIVEQFKLDPVEVELQIAVTLDKALAETSAEVDAPTKSAEVAARLDARKGINAKLLIQTLRQGEIALFENLLAQVTALRPQLIRRFIFEPGGQGLAIACRAIDIDKADFASIFLLSRGARPGDKIVDPSELGDALGFFDRIKTDTAQKVLTRWRIDPDFLFALKQVAGGRADSVLGPAARDKEA
jgi:hypothetical protein